ncbi:MAG TPA: hypothetical protein VGJ82_14585 [Thermoanaerobaculia bacterium]
MPRELGTPLGEGKPMTTIDLDIAPLREFLDAGGDLRAILGDRTRWLIEDAHVTATAFDGWTADQRTTWADRWRRSAAEALAADWGGRQLATAWWWYADVLEDPSLCDPVKSFATDDELAYFEPL